MGSSRAAIGDNISQRQANRVIMVNIVDLIEPVKDLLSADGVQEKVEDVARIFFTNGNLTVNLLPALLVGLGLMLFILPLLGIPILDMIFGAMTGVATAGYGSSYGATSYNQGTTGTGYGSAGYSSRAGDVQLTPEQQALFPELTELRTQIAQLKESEQDLRNHIYYNTANAVVDPAGAAGEIGYSY